MLRKTEMMRIEKLLQMMWHIDNKKEGKETLLLESKYVTQKLRDSLHFLNDQGMYEVACTWKPGQLDLPGNTSMALLRLLDRTAQTQDSTNRGDQGIQA